jgi:2-hydroxyglutarate dehydrogenase
MYAFLQLPNIEKDGLTPDYAGIRPNLAPPGSPFTDFHISYDPAVRPGLVGLCGFNSPGLTSSLAVGEAVEDLCRRDIWGPGSGKGKAKRQVSEVGGEGLEGWA